MNKLNDNILGINPISILSGNCILCIFSIMINIIAVSIILYFKFLHSILYHLLLFMSLSEIVNCIFHIIQSILVMLNANLNSLYIINSLIIYFTDTFSIILLGCLCDSMNVSILKHNKKIYVNQSYKLFSFIFSAVLTIVYSIFYLISKEDKFIYTELISWKFLSNENFSQVENLSINFFSYLITTVIYSLIISYSFFLIYRIYCFINEKSQEDAKKTKLNEFKFKMIKYPFFGFLWISSLILYSFSELFLGNNENDSDMFSKVKIIRIKYFLYFIYCFISSLRGVLFFKLFISNEKIKKFIQLKIKSIIILDNILENEIEGIKTKDNNINNNEKKNVFQEGLIDDRDSKTNTNTNTDSKEEDEKSDDDDGDDSDDEINKKNISAQLNRNNIEDDLIQSLSSLNETKKDNASENQKKFSKNI